ncbi:MAG: diguanylate cyclase [Chloroflexi bacterium]|nr:diguanylate cyclase [Chloroflexota bacterium]
MRILWWAALLAGWLCAGTALMGTVQSGVMLLMGIGMMAFSSVTMLLRPRQGLYAALVSISAFTLVWLWRERETGNPVAVLATATAIAGAVWMSWGVQIRALRLARGLSLQNHQIEALSFEVEGTGALKLEFGRSQLAEEVERCRRYRRSLAVLRVGPSAPDEWVRVHGVGQLGLLARGLAGLLRENLRTVDRIIQYDTAEYLVVLPETNLAGARIVAHKMARVAQDTLTSHVRIGIAEFPSSALSTDDLIREADAALAFARIADLTVASQT